jgi:anti-anti-sigma factor
MQLRQTDEQGVTVLELGGRVDSTTAADFGSRVESAQSAAQGRLLLDMRGLEYISSAGFRVLYLAARRSAESGGRFVICGMSATVRELFSIAGFLKTFTIVSTREEALAALK